ncbi:MAG: hypothetical protein AABN34_27915 [Acidobacteriota bacterium]
MKTLDVSDELPSVKELLELARVENVVLRTSEGREFILAEIDDFDRELELIRQNHELMEFLRLRSSEDKTFTLSEVREKLRLS